MSNLENIVHTCKAGGVLQKYSFGIEAKEMPHLALKVVGDQPRSGELNG